MTSIRLRQLSLLSILSACGDLSNQGDRPGQIHDLTSFAISPSQPQPQSADYRVVQRGARRALRPADSLFIRNGEVWTFLSQHDGARSLLTRHPDTGRGEEHVYEWMNGDRAVSATADDTGLIWFGLEYEVAALDLATETIVQRIAVGAQAPALSFGDGRLYVGDDQIEAIDIATGLIDQVYPFPASNLAVRDGTILVRELFFPEDDTFLLEAASGSITSYVGGLPHGAVTAMGSGYVGIDGSLEVVEFSFSDPIEMVQVTRAFAFNHAGARGLTMAHGLTWVLYADTEEGSLIGYDPATLAPVEGFAIDPAIYADLSFASSAGAGVGSLSLAFDGDDFLLVSSAPYTNQVDTRVRAIVYSTGALERAFEVPNATLTGVCHDGQNFWGVNTESGIGTRTTQTPQVYRLDPMNGIISETYRAPFELAGWPTVLCADDGPVWGMTGSRLWSTVPTATSTVVSHFAVPMLISAGSGHVSPNGITLIDYDRSLLIETSLPSALQP